MLAVAFMDEARSVCWVLEAGARHLLGACRLTYTQAPGDREQGAERDKDLAKITWSSGG